MLKFSEKNIQKYWLKEWLNSKRNLFRHPLWIILAELKAYKEVFYDPVRRRLLVSEKDGEHQGSFDPKE